MRQHMEESNREISLAVMIEDLPVLDEIDAIAAVPGIHLVAIGRRTWRPPLGLAAQSDHPKLVRRDRKGPPSALARGPAPNLALPMNHSLLPPHRGPTPRIGRRLL